MALPSPTHRRFFSSETSTSPASDPATTSTKNEIPSLSPSQLSTFTDTLISYTKNDIQLATEELDTNLQESTKSSQTCTNLKKEISAYVTTQKRALDLIIGKSTKNIQKMEETQNKDIAQLEQQEKSSKNLTNLI